MDLPAVQASAGPALAWSSRGLADGHGQTPSLQDDLDKLQGTWNLQVPNANGEQHSFIFHNNTLKICVTVFAGGGETFILCHKVKIKLQQEGSKRRIIAADTKDKLIPWTYRFAGKSLVIEDGAFQGTWARVAPAQPAPALELRLTSRKLAYTLDLGGKRPQEFLRPLYEAKLKQQGVLPAAAVAQFPPCPAVDLLLEIRNTGDRAVDIWTGGDYGAPLTLAVEGPGIHRFRCDSGLPSPPAPAQPAQKITLAPGKSHRLPIEQLMDPVSLAHRDGNRFYWTEPGAYTVRATWPLAAGADRRDGPVLVSNLVKIHVAPAPLSATVGRLKGMKEALKDIEKGVLKLKSIPPPAAPWYEDYLKLLKKQCGIDVEHMTTRVSDDPSPLAEMTGYSDLMRLEIEHRHGLGILDTLARQARDDYAKDKKSGR